MPQLTNCPKKHWCFWRLYKLRQNWGILVFKNTLTMRVLIQNLKKREVNIANGNGIKIKAPNKVWGSILL